MWQLLPMATSYLRYWNILSPVPCHCTVWRGNQQGLPSVHGAWPSDGLLWWRCRVPLHQKDNGPTIPSILRDPANVCPPWGPGPNRVAEESHQVCQATVNRKPGVYSKKLVRLQRADLEFIHESSFILEMFCLQVAKFYLLQMETGN